MVMENARSRNGTLHFYFRCAGLNTHECDLPRFRLADVEEAVAGHYATLTMAPHLTQHQLDSLSTTHLAHAADTIHTLTDLLQQPYQLYNQLNATQRQHLNHLLFQRLYLDTHDTDPDRTPHIDHDVSDTLAPLHHHLHHTTHNTKNPAPKNSEQGSINTKMVDDTGIEPVTSPVSGVRSPAELIVRDYSRWRRDLNPCTRLCRPLPRLSATPPQAAG